MNKDIDDLFSDKMGNEIKNEIIRKRGKSNRKLILTSILATILIIFVGNLIVSTISNKYIFYSAMKDTENNDLEYRIKHANEYIGEERYHGTGYFRYEGEYIVGKKIGDKVFYNGTLKYSGGLDSFRICGWVGENGRGKIYGLKNLIFKYPYINYESILKDFNRLDEIEDNKIVEMALSFDKQYTFEEVNNMVNKNLTTFYWVDNSSDEQKENKINANSKLDENQDTVIGIKSMNQYGDIMYNVKDRQDNFIDAVKKLRLNGNEEIVQNIDENNIKIIGVVVVGSIKELKALQENSMIKHAIIGNVVDKY